MLIGLILLCGALSLVYGGVTVSQLMAASAGSPRMQEIAGAIAEGAQAYLKRQYLTIAIVGLVVFVALGFLLSWEVALGFVVGAVLFPEFSDLGSGPIDPGARIHGEIAGLTPVEVTIGAPT